MFLDIPFAIIDLLPSLDPTRISYPTIFGIRSPVGAPLGGLQGSPVDPLNLGHATL